MAPMKIVLVLGFSLIFPNKTEDENDDEDEYDVFILAGAALRHGRLLRKSLSRGGGWRGAGGRPRQRSLGDNGPTATVVAQPNGWVDASKSATHPRACRPSLLPRGDLAAIFFLNSHRTPQRC